MKILDLAELATVTGGIKRPKIKCRFAQTGSLRGCKLGPEQPVEPQIYDDN